MTAPGVHTCVDTLRTGQALKEIIAIGGRSRGVSGNKSCGRKRPMMTTWFTPLKRCVCMLARISLRWMDFHRILFASELFHVSPLMQTIFSRTERNSGPVSFEPWPPTSAWRFPAGTQSFASQNTHSVEVSGKKGNC